MSRSPKNCVMLNGGKSIDESLKTLDFSRSEKPTDNALIESFNGSVRAECLKETWFLSLDDAKGKKESWR